MRCFYPDLLFTSMRRIELYSHLILMNDDDDTYPKNQQVSHFGFAQIEKHSRLPVSQTL